MLNELATIGLSHLRELDIFGRLGGDEFAILLPDTTAEGASLVAERMRASFEKHTVLIAQKRVTFHRQFRRGPFLRSDPVPDQLDQICRSGFIYG